MGLTFFCPQNEAYWESALKNGLFQISSPNGKMKNTQMYIYIGSFISDSLLLLVQYKPPTLFV